MFVKGDMLPADSPVRYGCFLVIGIGVILAGIGGWLLVTAQGPTPLRVALVIVGVAAGLLGHAALYGSRIGWAFATALTGTLGVAFLFGAPKLRDALYGDTPDSLHLVVAALPAVIFAIATILLSLTQPETAPDDSADS